MSTMSHPYPHLRLLGAASCLGARDRRCDLGPELLRDLGLQRILRAAGCEAVWQAILHPHKTPLITGYPSGVDRTLTRHVGLKPHLQLINTVGVAPEAADVIAELCQRLAVEVAVAVRAGVPFAVLGGDHSCAIGTWSGVAAVLPHRRPLGLIWIDAHMDSHTPETSASGALHGMPLASLLGYGDARLTGVQFAGPKLFAEHVCLIGVRSYEPAEAEFLRQHKVRVYFMDEVRERGLFTVMNEAYELISRGTTQFGVSIDLDAIDPLDAPGVGSPEPGGITVADLLHALAPLSVKPGLLGIEIAEFNPARDHDDKTARVIMRLMEEFFTGGGQ